MLERKIYSGWAFSDNPEEKFRINKEIYQEIKDKAKVRPVKCRYGTTYYRVLENPENLSELELALICDKGNLCFGYRREGDYIVIYTD